MYSDLKNKKKCITAFLLSYFLRKTKIPLQISLSLGAIKTTTVNQLLWFRLDI